MKYLLPTLLIRSVLLLLLYLPIRIFSQVVYWYPDQQPFVKYNDELQLFNKEIFSLRQDKHGYFWIGAGDLLKYDGYKVTTYPNPGHEDFKGMYKSLRIPFIDKYNRPWVNFAGRIFIFDPEGETFEEVFTEFPKECVEIEDGNIWCTTVNGLLNYSFPHETKKPQIQYILNRSYHSDLFPFLAELLQGSNRIFQIENDPFTTPSKKYKITIEDSSDYLFFAVHPKNQTFHISQFGKKIWRSDDSLKTNTKSVPTRSISYGTVSLSVGNYELEISGESQPWTKPHKQSIPSNSEYEYRGVSLFKLSPSQTQLFDSIELDFQQNKFRPLPPFPNSQWLSQIEDSLFWYANPTYGFQEVVLKDGVMLKRKIIADTLFHSGEIKTWLTQHYLPLDKRFVLMIGGNNIGRLTNGKILYPMAILDTEEEKLISVKHDLSKSSFLNPGYGYIAYRIHRDANGDFWMGTSSHGLLKFRLPDNWEKEEQIDLQIEHINLIEIEKASYESSTHVTDVSPDPYGNLWASSHTNGIFKIEHDATNISKLSYPDWINTTKFKSEMIEWGGSLWVDKKDKVWISQYPNHLGWFNDSTNTFEKFTTTGENFSENYRGILYEDGQENFWAFSKGECLYKINKRTYTVDKIPFPEGSRINKVFEDVKGQLWATDVHANFYKIDPVLLNISPFNMYSEGTQVRKWDGLWTVQNDKKGNTWMSFHAGGLGKLSYEKLPSGRDSIIFEEFIPSMRCIAISIDKKGKLWLGHPDGIYVFDPEKEEIVKTIGKKEGFDGNWVLGLFIDKHDRIWFIANSTLGFYDQVQQKTFVPEALSNLKLFEPSSISSKGVLTTAALDGIIRVGINTFQLDNPPPSVLIEKIITQGQDKKNQLNLIYTEDRTKQIDFPWSENSLEIQYTGIHYDDPVENRFQYQLVGVDDDWIDVGQERIARYPNLPSGTYTFQVKAVNANGFWSEATSVTFRVLPPWWRTWWAYTLYILAIAGLVYAFYRFQLNRQLAEAEANKFREIDEVKSRLYTNITHEFRTPLTIIDGLTDQIKGFDKLRHIIKRNTGQLLNLVNQLLDLAKMEEGKLSIDYIQADVIPFMHSIADTFNNVSEAKNIHFSVSSEPKELYMDFDKEKLQHILTNLLSNALKFTPEGGKVELLTTRTEENLFKIQVKDSGIGISEEKLPHIFNRFYQGDQSDTRKWEGTGIGLALVKELTQLLDGQIEVISNEDTGSTFSVTLPIMNEAPLTEIVTLSPTFTVGNSTVVQKENFILSLEPQAPRALIVEDNEDVIFYLKTQLSKSYQLIVARNGREGIERALNLIPDIIISDIMMPEVDGLELCQTLKNNPHTSHIPIILLTAKGDIESKISGLSKGADAYLPKPFNQRELEIRLEQLIASRKKMQQQFSKGKWGEIELPQNPQLRQEYEFLKKVTDYIKANLSDEDLSIPKIAGEVNMERSQLYRKINQLTGHSPSHLLKQLRLQKAHELIVHSNMNVSEIAFECGFKELPSLSRNYKAYFGKTPTEERKERKPKV